jgi:nucleoside-diphosphate-sugar epimerase
MEHVITSEDQLDDLLSTPPPVLVDGFRRLDGDLLVLGAGGKLGPTLARMAARAAGGRFRVIAVSRFSSLALRRRLEGWGIETIACDLLAPGTLARLPRCRHVVHLAARKLGAAGTEGDAWATNTQLAGEMARAFPGARIVAFSTGNVYPLAPVTSPGPDETTPPVPSGEYAQSCLGRERVLEYFSRRDGTPMTLIRLSYAAELRYGVLVDLARKIAAGTPVDLTTSHVNVIWQGDASAYALSSFAICSTPPLVLNVTGLAVSVREMAQRLGALMKRTPQFTGTPQSTARLSDAARCHALFGPPRVPVDTLLRWVAHWVTHGGTSLGKPTRFEVRDGSV